MTHVCLANHVSAEMSSVDRLFLPVASPTIAVTILYDSGKKKMKSNDLWFSFVEA